MKKLLALVTVGILALAVVSCGQAPASAPASMPASAPASTPASAPSSTPADDAATYTLDYEIISAWLYGGYLGQTDDGAPALLGVNEDTTMAIVVFGDNDTMEAVSFVGEFVDNGDGTATINDTENQLSLTFGFEKDGDTTFKMDMGEEMGFAIVSPVALDELKSQLQLAIENYKHVA